MADIDTAKFVPMEQYEQLLQINKENYAQLEDMLLMYIDGELATISTAATFKFLKLHEKVLSNGRRLTTDGKTVALV